MTQENPSRCRITEYLDLDLEHERWLCNRCEHDLGAGRSNYKEGCLVKDRNPHEVHRPIIEGPYSFAPDPAWCKVVEFYCPGCGTMLEVEYLPPGHPITHDIEIDIDAIKKKHGITIQEDASGSQNDKNK
jgi:acetophenone carboxylase